MRQRNALGFRFARLTGSVAGVAAILLTAGVSMASATATSAAGCQPGSGPRLAGVRLTNGEISDMASGALRCANLSGADLSGLSLGQVDLTGAILRGANLAHADLTQATLVDADLSGADLQKATLDQASLQHADLSGADLSGASMIQTQLTGANLSHAKIGGADLSQATLRQANLSGADLTGASMDQADLTGANLSRAKIGGADFTEATISGTNFAGVTGEPPYSWYLLIGALVVFALLVMRTVGQARRAIGGRTGTGRASGPAWILARGLIGAVVIALGLHMAVGGLAGEYLFGTLVSQTCSTGPLCTVGVGSGFAGIYAGIGLVLIGAAITGARRRARAPSATRLQRLSG